MIQIRNLPDRWGVIAQALHWSMAALITAQFALGWIAVTWRLSPTKLELFVWHKSMGVVLLLLAVLRLGWRVFNPAPAPAQTTTRLQRGLASASHALLYVLMIAMPLSGWVINSAANVPFRVFGIVPWPDLAGPDERLQALAQIVHLSLFWAFVLVLALHTGAALRHHLVVKDDVVRRMLPYALHRHTQRSEADTPP